jgi:hypothetical protein
VTSFCPNCGDEVASRRRLLGYRTCLTCGDAAARQVKFTVIPAYSKGAYQVVSRDDIALTNPKRTGE